MAYGSPVIPTTRGHPNYRTPSVPILLRNGQIPAATTTRWKKKKRLLGISSSALTLPTSIYKAPTSDIDGQRCCRSSNARRKNNNQIPCQRVLTYRSCRKDYNNNNIAEQSSGYDKTIGKKPFPSVLLGAVPLSYLAGSVASSGETARCAVDVSSELSNSPPTNAITQQRRPCKFSRTTATSSPEHGATGSRYSEGSDVRPTANKKRAIVEKNATLASTVAYETFTRPGKIWHCPTASSLREEVVADLGSVNNQRRLWRSLRPFEARNAARNELEITKSIFKADKKSMGADGRLLATMQAEITEDVMERWMRRTARMRSGRFTLAQKRELRKWFDSLDKDGSGEINSSELSNPLLSTGLARSAVEIDEMVQDVDRDGSGEICFQEFLAVFQRHQRGNAPSSSSVVQPRTRVQGNAIEKLVTLQGVKDAHGSDMETVVAFERRSVLMREIIDEANYREAVLEDLANRRYLAERNGDQDALKAMDASEARLEARRVENNRYIQAVSNATNFKEERQKVNKAMESDYREPQLGRSISSSKITLACIHDGGEKGLTPRSEESETFQHDEEPHHPHEQGTTRAV